jgi:aquaporin Z
LSDAIGYWVAQFAGATMGSLIILAATGERAAVAATATGYTDLQAAIVAEIVLTTVFVWTILSVTRLGAGHAPMAIALALVGVHVVGIPFSGASVNPARSFGPALVGGDMGSSLWLYLYAPMIGAVIAWGLYRLFPPTE